MPNKIPNLLTPTELLDIYSAPILSNAQRHELFTFNEQETKTLKSFKNIKDSIYFAVCLAFFKTKQTLVDFNYQDITTERQYVMKRYFPEHQSPKSLPPRHTKFRIENKVLILCGYQRFNNTIRDKVKKELFESAVHYPRQRQLCKELLNSL